MTTFWSRERLVNTTTANGQLEPSVTVLSDGGTVVTWRDSEPSPDLVRMQRFDAEGNPVGTETTVGSSSTFAQPEITALANGGWAVGWMSTNTIVSMQRYTASGAADGAVINVAADGNSAPVKAIDLLELANGSIAVVYGRQAGGEADVVLRIVSSAGLVGNAISVDAGAGVVQNTPYIASNGSNIVVTWRDSVNGGDVQARTFSLTGGSLAGEVTLNTQTANAQEFSAIAALVSGGYVSVWSDRNDGSVRGQILSSSLAARGGEFVVSFDASGNEAVAVAATQNGGFFVAYRADGALYGQAMSSLGTLVGTRVVIATSLDFVNGFDLSAFADGRIAVSWTANTDANGLDASSTGIYTRIVDPRHDGGLVQGDASANTLTGHPTLADWITGFGGADTLSGLGGDDTLEGGNGADRLFGGDGQDFLYGGTGSDFLSGGDGDDTMDGEADEDMLSGGRGVDAISGGAGNDTLIGGTEGDYLYGGSDNDLLYGEAGVDALFGETGNDTLVGGNDGDYLYGDAGIDRLYGEASSDALFGGEGDDFLYGQDGIDYLYGDPGADQIEGGAGNDVLFGGAGNDTLVGGLGSDFIYFEGTFGLDTVADFSRSEGDRLVFSAAEVNPQGGVGLQYYASSNTSVFSVAGLGQVYVNGQLNFSDIMLV